MSNLLKIMLLHSIIPNPQRVFEYMSHTDKWNHGDVVEFVDFCGGGSNLFLLKRKIGKTY
jgi:hypothetical protein